MKAALQLALVLALFASLAAFGYFGLAWLDARADSAAVEETIPLELERAPAPRPLGAPRDPAPGAAGTALAAPVPGREDWAALNNAGVEALENERPAEAVELLERCHAAQPDEPIVRANLAQALLALALARRLEDPVCADCLELAERALALAPEREDLAALAERWRTEAEVHKDFWEESSLYFDLAYDGSRTEILRESFRVLDHLDKIYARLREAFDADPVRDGRPRIPVILYARSDFDEVTGLGDWAGGAFDGKVRVPVGDGVSLDDPALQRVLAHEVAHAFVLAVGDRSVPGWLNEGLAQWLEPDAQQSVEAARAALAGRELVPLEKLAGTLATWQDAEQIKLAYAESLLVCEHVARQYGERVLFELVSACREGRAPADTFRARVGIELSAVVGDLQAELE